MNSAGRCEGYVSPELGSQSLREIRPSMDYCEICGAGTHQIESAQEMMFGLGEHFVYRQCSGCGVLCLANKPSDLSPYYPSNYYSFTCSSFENSSASGFRRYLNRRRNSGQVLGHSLFWRTVARCRPRPDLVLLESYFKGTKGLTFASRVLDVGCGSGELLRQMREVGFTNLTGVDPFLKPAKSQGLNLKRGELSDLNDGQFDFIMLHHSLEHMVDQRTAFEDVRRLLAPGGFCLIRVPIGDSDPWQRYGVQWVELDAPRHFFIHTKKSIKLLAEQHDLEVESVNDDSTAFGYWGSELYKQGLTLIDSKDGRIRDPSIHFSKTEMVSFEELAADANEKGMGGRSAFLLRPKR